MACQFWFVDPVPGKDEAGNTADASESEEVSKKKSYVYELAFGFDDAHAYEDPEEEKN